MTNLLTLPTEISLHTPFTVYIIATITIAHLSACKFVLKEKELQIARERIRVAMGALESFADIWPRGKKVVADVKTIARELLRLVPDNRSALPSEDGTRKSSNPGIQTTFHVPSDKRPPAEPGFLSTPALDSFGFIGENFGVDLLFPSTGLTMFPNPPKVQRWILAATTIGKLVNSAGLQAQFMRNGIWEGRLQARQRLCDGQ
jgi:hypothetical protein